MQSQDRSAATNFIQTGDRLKDESNLEEAIASYQKALEIQPDDAEVHERLGQVYFAGGKIAEAIASCQLALKLQPNFAAAYKTLGNALQAQGKIEQAIRAYSKAVELNPDFAEAHANIGSMFSKQGQWEAAIPYLQKAIVLKPDLAAAHWNLGNTLVRQDCLEEAIQSWRRASELKPEQFNGEIFNNLGTNLGQEGNLEAAIACYQRAIELKPKYLLAQLNLGSVFQQLQRWDEAIAVFQNAREIKPNDTESQGYLAVALYRLGNVFKQQNRLEAAIDCWQKALELKPEIVSAETLNDLGTGLGQKGDFESAIDCYQRAIDLNPNYPMVRLNLGTALQQQERLDEAIGQLNRAVELKPDYMEAYNCLGNVLVKQDKFEPAIAAYQKAIEIRSDNAETYFNLGKALAKQEKYEAAIAAYEKAIEIKADLWAAHAAIIEIISNPLPENNKFAHLRKAADRYLQNCGETGKSLASAIFINTHLKSGLYQVAKERFLEIEPQIYQTDLSPIEAAILYTHLAFNIYHLRDDLTANTKLAKFIAKSYVEKIINTFSIEIPAERQKYRPSSQLKIGFMSSNFGRHSVGWCSADVIRELAKITPNLYLYVTGERPQDDRTKIFKQASAKFYIPNKIVVGTPDRQEIIEQILQDKLDILIGLDSLTVPFQVDILHRRPAPVCLSWLGFEPPFTTADNYFLCDWHSHPAGVEESYCEKLVRMPNSFTAIAGFECQAVEKKKARKGLRLAEDQIVYLCIAPGYKLNPDLVKAQIKIIRQVPDSVLIYKSHTGDSQIIQSLYRQECENQGVSFHRIKFLPLAKTEEEHRMTYKIADVLLDSYPYNGATHTLEALWFDLPIVTRTGEQHLSRLGYSLLQGLSLTSGVSQNWEEYVDWGVKLGKDGDLRKMIQEHLVRSKQPEHLAPLWNPKKFARDMYAALEQLLNKYKE